MMKTKKLLNLFLYQLFLSKVIKCFISLDKPLFYFSNFLIVLTYNCLVLKVTAVAEILLDDIKNNYVFN